MDIDSSSAQSFGYGLVTIGNPSLGSSAVVSFGGGKVHFGTGSVADGFATIASSGATPIAVVSKPSGSVLRSPASDFTSVCVVAELAKSGVRSIYVNGALSAKGKALGAPLTPASAYHIKSDSSYAALVGGAPIESSANFVGAISDVKVYNRAISAAEAAEIAASPIF